MPRRLQVSTAMAYIVRQMEYALKTLISVLLNIVASSLMVTKALVLADQTPVYRMFYLSASFVDFIFLNVFSLPLAYNFV